MGMAAQPAKAEPPSPSSLTTRPEGIAVHLRGPAGALSPPTRAGKLDQHDQTPPRVGAWSCWLLGCRGRYTAAAMHRAGADFARCRNENREPRRRGGNAEGWHAR